MHRLSPLLAVVLSGCSPQARHATPTSAPAGAPSLELAIVDAEVWTFSLPLTGSVRAGALSDCTVEVGRRAQQTRTTSQRFSTVLALDAGENLVQARCRTQAGHALTAPLLRLTVRLADAPSARANARIVSDSLVLDASASTPSPGSGAELARYEWRSGDGEGPVLGSKVSLTLPLPREAGIHRFALSVHDARGAIGKAKAAIEVTVDRAARSIGEEAPTWVDEAIVYGVIPSLYGTPPLRKLAERLDGLADLGVNTLWLSPLFASPDDDFGYGVTDYFTVRDGLGGDQALRALVKAAHARKLRVLLDLPLNHTSTEHPYFQQAARLGARSHYFGFYERNAAGDPTNYFDWKHLPNLDYGNGEVQQWALAFSTYWLEELDIDGYRVDAAWGVKQRSPDFYPRWRSELKRVKPDVLLLAEASARDPYYLRRGYDAAYDWTHELGQHAWESVFASPRGVAARLRDAMSNAHASTRRPERTLRFLNNNDTGDRFITRHGEPLTRVATAALLTLPGIPCLYAFDEVGFGFRPYDEQVPEQPERPALRTLHRTLIALRKRLPALRGTGYQVLVQDGELLAYLRRGDQPGEVAIVALNFGDAPVVQTLTLPDGALPTRATLRDALSERAAPIRAGKVALSLPPYSFQVLVRDRAGR